MVRGRNEDKGERPRKQNWVVMRESQRKKRRKERKDEVSRLGLPTGPEVTKGEANGGLRPQELPETSW